MSGVTSLVLAESSMGLGAVAGGCGARAGKPSRVWGWGLDTPHPHCWKRQWVSSGGGQSRAPCIRPIRGSRKVGAHQAGSAGEGASLPPTESCHHDA